MKDNHKTPKEHNPFNVFPDDASILCGVISSAYEEAIIQDKIREEVRKQTAKEILQELYNRLELVSEDGLHTMMVCNTHLFDLAKQFNVELEDEV